jgi:hypothetical protein
LLHQIEAAKALLQTGIIEVPGRVQPGIQCLVIRRSRPKRELGDEGQGLNQRHQTAAMALEPAREFKLEQHGAHDRGRRLRHPDLDRRAGWGGSEPVDDAGRSLPCGSDCSGSLSPSAK